MAEPPSATYPLEHRAPEDTAVAASRRRPPRWTTGEWCSRRPARPKAGPGPSTRSARSRCVSACLSEAALRLLETSSRSVAVAHQSRPRPPRRLLQRARALAAPDHAGRGDRRTHRDPERRPAPCTPRRTTRSARPYAEANQAIGRGATCSRCWSATPSCGAIWTRRPATRRTPQRDPFAARGRVRDLYLADRQPRSVDLAAPPTVTLASANGHFSALVSSSGRPGHRRGPRHRRSQIEISSGDTVELAPTGGRRSCGQRLDPRPGVTR
jgi:hypothetical protein